MKDNIWFTYKARIKAHERLEWMDFHSQSLLVWYALLSAALAVVTTRYPTLLGKDTDMLSATLSIGLLAISLSVANRDFRGRAMLMRGNYQELHKLHRSAQSQELTPTELDSYSDLLRDCENHRSIDDILARVFATNLTTRRPSGRERVIGYGAIFAKYFFAAALYAGPFLVAAMYAMGEKCDQGP